MIYNRCNCPNYINTVDIIATADQLILTIPKNEFRNGSIIFLHIVQSIPQEAADLPVAILLEEGKTPYNVFLPSGNFVRADTLRTNYIYQLRVGTDPDHFTYSGEHRLPRSIYPLSNMKLE